MSEHFEMHMSKSQNVTLIETNSLGIPLNIQQLFKFGNVS